MKEKENIVIYQGENGDIELRADTRKDTIWATRTQISQLFETTPQNISIHLGNLYKEGELEEKATSKKSLLVQKEGGKSKERDVDLYNLDAIIAVGYRVSSKKATQFRIWATKTLREYLVRGHAFNHYKLDKEPEAMIGLYKAVTLLEAKDIPGKVRAKISIKIEKDLEPANN